MIPTANTYDSDRKEAHIEVDLKPNSDCFKPNSVYF